MLLIVRWESKSYQYYWCGNKKEQTSRRDNLQDVNYNRWAVFVRIRKSQNWNCISLVYPSPSIWLAIALFIGGGPHLKI